MALPLQPTATAWRPRSPPTSTPTTSTAKHWPEGGCNTSVVCIECGATGSGLGCERTVQACSPSGRGAAQPKAAVERRRGREQAMNVGSAWPFTSGMKKAGLPLGLVHVRRTLPSPLLVAGRVDEGPSSPGVSTAIEPRPSQLRRHSANVRSSLLGQLPPPCPHREVPGGGPCVLRSSLPSPASTGASRPRGSALAPPSRPREQGWAAAAPGRTAPCGRRMAPTIRDGGESDAGAAGGGTRELARRAVKGGGERQGAQTRRTAPRRAACIQTAEKHHARGGGRPDHQGSHPNSQSRPSRQEPLGPRH